MRVVWWPEDEVSVLSRRHHTSTTDDVGSEVSLVRRGLRCGLRGTVLGYEDCTQPSYDTNDLGDAFGVFVPVEAARRVAWWFSGVGKRGPDDAQMLQRQREQGKRRDNGSGDVHQMWDVLPAQIVERLQMLLPHVDPAAPLLPVNEAFLPYKLEDVVALLVNPKDLKSVARAGGFLFGLMKKTEKEVPMYSYDCMTGTVQLESFEKMAAAFPQKNFKRKFKDYSEFYEMIWLAEAQKKRK